VVPAEKSLPAAGREPLGSALSEDGVLVVLRPELLVVAVGLFEVVAEDLLELWEDAAVPPEPVANVSCRLARALFDSV
jgi:hypothetical protein